MRSFSFLLAVSLLCACPDRGHAQSVSILFTGDILLDRGVRRVIEHKGIDALFSPSVDSLLHHTDLVVGNLECPVTDIKAPVFKRFIFRGEPSWLEALHRHGFTHLNLANNHAIDQGRDGLTDTRHNILKAGMTPVGAGSSMTEAARPVLLTDKPRKVWLIGSLQMALENWAYLPDRPCVSQEPLDSVISHIRRLKADDPTAVIIVSLHWGAEHTLQPVPRQRMDARRLISAGADALICHHTHTLQTVETYQGKPIYYSIGNFIFDEPRPINARAAVVLLRITRDGMTARPIDIHIKNCTPHLQQ